MRPELLSDKAQRGLRCAGALDYGGAGSFCETLQQPYVSVPRQSLESAPSGRLPRTGGVKNDSGAPGSRSKVHALPLLAKDAEDFDRTGAGSSEPVRILGVELGGLACHHRDDVLAEH